MRMDFRTFYTSLPVAERESFAIRANTTRGYCNQVAYGAKEIELGMADVFVALADGALTHDDLPLTARARKQRAIRSPELAATPTPDSTDAPA